MKQKTKLRALLTMLSCWCSMVLLSVTAYAEEATGAAGADQGSSTFMLLAGGLIVIIAVVVVISAVSSVIGAVAGEVEDEED